MPSSWLALLKRQGQLWVDCVVKVRRVCFSGHFVAERDRCAMLSGKILTLGGLLAGSEPHAALVTVGAEASVRVNTYHPECESFWHPNLPALLAAHTRAANAASRLATRYLPQIRATR